MMFCLDFVNANIALNSRFNCSHNSDCPFIDPGEIERVLDSHLNIHDCDYSTNTFSDFNCRWFRCWFTSRVKRANQYAILP